MAINNETVQNITTLTFEISAASNLYTWSLNTNTYAYAYTY